MKQGLKKPSKNKDRVAICMKAYDHRLLDKCIKRVIEAVEKSGASIIGPVPLPTKIKRYTVIRSPHKDKSSREQFEMRVHRRVLEISNSNAKVMSSLSSFDLPAGVGIELKQK